MKRFLRSAVFTMLALVTLTGAYAQKTSNSKSVSIQIVAVVPAVLKLSLDFSNDASANLTGYIPANGTVSGNAAYALNNDLRFEIKTGAVVHLGNASLFSNVTSSYTVKVHSANGGALRDLTGTDKTAIPYELYLGDTASTAEGGTFSFAAAGKSSKYSEPFSVALAIRDVPQSAASGSYSDRLMFSVSAN